MEEQFFLDFQLRFNLRQKCIGELKKPQYDDTKAIVSNFTWLAEEEVCRLFSSVGLSSIPTYLRKVHELSLGEKARLDLAFLISTAKDDEIILCDEYSSMLDRDWAMSMSYSLQRYIRRINKKIILATSNTDVIEWIQPDWILNLNKPQDDTVNIEWQIYADDKEYETYKQIAAQDMLTEIKELP
ncbi:hypothetical protein [Bacteroides sp. 51]|uniref:hypothetical protein n=1 Tax=Bacteroides sp. 51 TaxID=2302938 RepID=UPI0013D1E1FE|nr:hypothetical protein [Bacteroides sp. 51]NDV83731.1 hypothetical protein [Bacteroides sp. 51]